MGAFHIEAVLAIAYALALIIIATALEWLAKHSQQRADRYHTGGFRFDRDRDAWECPVGIALLRAEIDPERHAVVYRAPAHTCNSCQIKSRCTHSDRGREIVVPLDPWVRSASVRLQRGISFVLILLAAFILGIELFRHAHGVEGSALAVMLAIVAARFLKLLSEVRSHSTSG